MDRKKRKASNKINKKCKVKDKTDEKQNKKQKTSDSEKQEHRDRMRKLMQEAADSCPTLATDTESSSRIVPNNADSKHETYGACSWCKGASHLTDQCYWHYAFGDQEFKRPVCIDCIPGILNKQEQKEAPIPKEVIMPYIHSRVRQDKDANLCPCCKQDTQTDKNVYLLRMLDSKQRKVDIAACMQCCQSMTAFY